MIRKLIESNGHTYDCVKDFGYDHRIGVKRDDTGIHWFTSVEEVEYFYPNLVGKMDF